jgi:hypothetical protein
MWPVRGLAGVLSTSGAPAAAAHHQGAMVAARQLHMTICLQRCLYCAHARHKCKHCAGQSVLHGCGMAPGQHIVCMVLNVCCRW